MKKEDCLLSLGANPKDFDLKNITRVGSERINNGWWVRTNRDGMKKSKVFSDQYYVSPIAALQAAIQFRDSIRPKRIFSNTGYRHIFISIEDKEYAILRVNYKNIEKAFSINAEDYFSALIKAIKYLNRITKQQYMPIVDKINTDRGLTYLNKNLHFEIYKEIFHKTLIAKENYYKNNIENITNKKKTILIVSHKNSIMDKNAIYSTQMRATLGYIKRKGYTYKIVGEDFEYNKREYFAVYIVTKDTTSKEFCFRLKKLIDMRTKKFYTIQKESPIFKGIYKDNPNVLKEIINIIPDFKTKDELHSYFEKQIKNTEGLIVANAKKINANLTNKDYVKRKKLQIKYFKNKIKDYKQLIDWSKQK